MMPTADVYANAHTPQEPQPSGGMPAPGGD